jgi:hypothetical protein
MWLSQQWFISIDLIFVWEQPYSTILLGMPFPHPTPEESKGFGIGNSGTCPRPRFEGCVKQHTGLGGNFSKRMPGMQRGPKAKQSHPTYSIVRCDLHLRVIIWLTGGYVRYILLPYHAEDAPEVISVRTCLSVCALQKASSSAWFSIFFVCKSARRDVELLFRICDLRVKYWTKR